MTMRTAAGSVAAPATPADEDIVPEVDPSGALRSVWYLGPLVAAWALILTAAIVAAPVFAAWLASPSPWEMGVAAPLRMSVLAWVVMHDVPARVDGVPYSLMPWGLAAIPFWLLWQGGRWARRVSGVIDVRASITLVGWTACCYAAVVATATWVVSAPGLRLSAPRAFCTALVIAAGAVAVGVYRKSDVGAAVRREMPAALRVAIGAATVATATLLVLGCGLAAVSLVRHFSDAVAIATSLDAGPVGGAALLVLGLGYLPVMASWAVAYAVGAGVWLGPGLLAAPFNALPESALLPPFPLLAAVPSRSLAWPMAPMAIGVCAGLLLGWYVARSAARPAIHRVVLAMCGSVLAGLMMAIIATISRGSLGEGRLADLGPNPPSVATAVIGLLLVGSMPTALILRPRKRLRTPASNGDQR